MLAKSMLNAHQIEYVWDKVNKNHVKDSEAHAFVKR